MQGRGLRIGWPARPSSEGRAEGLKIYVNGNEYLIERPEGTLLAFLRRELGLVGTKMGCGEGHCGSCTVLVDGRARKSCRARLNRLDGASVETIENLARDGRPHPLQMAFMSRGAVQCGFCTPGMIMAAKGFLDHHPTPADEEIRWALRGNLCRCTGYASIFRAVRLAAWWLRRPAAQPDPADWRLTPSGWRPAGRSASDDGDAPPSPGCARPERQAGGQGAATLRFSGSGAWTGRAALGRSVPKVDAAAKVTGAAIYADDLQRPDMLYGRLVYGGRPHARVAAIDTAGAQALPGVVAVLTAADIPGLNAFGMITPQQPVLAADIVRYTGDSVAVVYAETEAIAGQAAALVRVIAEPLPGVYSPEAALSEDAPQIHPGGNILSRTTIKKGDVNRGFALADVVVEGAYTTQSVEHAYLEPESALAEIDAAGKVTVWSGSQAPHLLRRDIARTLALPAEQVRVILTPTGGAFGGKTEPVVQIQAALGAWKTGRPVKMTLTRRESIIKSTKRHPEKIYMKHGATRDGRLLAVEARIVADTGAYASLGMPVVSQSAAVAAGPYRVPNFSAEAVAVYTNNAVSGAFRGFGTTQAAFAGEIQIDRLARRLGLDPLAFRRRNALRVGDTMATGQVVEPAAAFDETLAAIQSALARLVLPQSDDRRKIGVGVASAYKSIGRGGGRSTGAGATVALDDEGRIVIMTGAADMGQGSSTTMAQIAAAAGGFPLCCITVIAGDTDLCPDAGTTTASCQTFESGNAVSHAAAELGERLREAVAACWEKTPSEIGFDEQGAAAGERKMSFRDVFRLLGDRGVKPRASYHHTPPPLYPIPAIADRQPGVDPERYRLHYAYVFGTHAAVVSVDTATGEVRVLRVLAAYEVGKAIHPQNARTQIEGSILMGIGYTLMEEFRMSQGRAVTDNLKKLHLPGSMDVPAVEVYFVEDPHPDGPFGAKGLGELPVNPMAPAVLNAVYDAVGVRLYDLPATPDKVLAALRATSSFV